MYKFSIFWLTKNEKINKPNKQNVYNNNDESYKKFDKKIYFNY